MKIKKYKFQEGDSLPDGASLTPTTENSVTEQVNEFNNK